MREPDFQVEAKFILFKYCKISLKIKSLVCGLQAYMVVMSLPCFLAYSVYILLHMLVSGKDICNTILFIPENSSNLLIISC